MYFALIFLCLESNLFSNLFNNYIYYDISSTIKNNRIVFRLDARIEVGEIEISIQFLLAI